MHKLSIHPAFHSPSFEGPKKGHWSRSLLPSTASPALLSSTTLHTDCTGLPFEACGALLRLLAMQMLPRNLLFCGCQHGPDPSQNPGPGHSKNHALLVSTISHSCSGVPSPLALYPSSLSLCCRTSVSLVHQATKGSPAHAHSGNE